MKFLLAFSGALVVLALGCKRDVTGSGTAKPIASDADAAMRASSQTAFADAAITPETVEVELQSLTRRWNDALARRNAAALDAVYGARIRLYGATVDRKTAVKMKAAALTDDYTQSIGSVALNTQDPAHPRTLFDKTWKKKGKELRLGRDGRERCKG